MSEVEQKAHLITSESESCDLVSPYSRGHGLAKLPPCACRGDEPQQQCRTCKQPSWAGICCAAEDMPYLWGQNKINPRSSIRETQGLPQTPLWVKCKCVCRKRGESKAKHRLGQSPVGGLSSGSSGFRIFCPAEVPLPLPVPPLAKGNSNFYECLELQPGNCLQEIFILLSVSL